MQKFKPLRDRVLARRLPMTVKSKGGIHIPQSAQEKPIEGEVMEVGTGTIDNDGVLHPVEVKVGDRILFGKYAGTEITLNGEEHLVLKEDEIMGILHQKE